MYNVYYIGGDHTPPIYVKMYVYMDKNIESYRKILKRMIESYKQISHIYEPTFDLLEDTTVIAVQEFLDNPDTVQNKAEVDLFEKLRRFLRKGYDDPTSTKHDKFLDTIKSIKQLDEYENQVEVGTTIH